jgi:hypothetical protein
MLSPPYANFQERVLNAAQEVLSRDGSVGPLELLQQMRMLQPVHFDGWRNGSEDYLVLEEWIQVGPEKFQKVINHFQQWVHARGLCPVEAAYSRKGARGVEPLRVTRDGDPEREKFYRTHYAPPDLSKRKAAKLAGKLSKPPDLVVFEKMSKEGDCSECGAELSKGSYLVMERTKPLCLNCADLDGLVFLPAGDAALSRRARKYSSLSAVVVRFNRRIKKYARQGLLVTEKALAKAQEECAADAPARAAIRERSAIARTADDLEFVEEFTREILKRYPACPPEEAGRIALHAGERSSGRVGRSAAGRALNAKAVDLAVVAHVRHAHTNYDELLMAGTERFEARAQVREMIDGMIGKWSAG